MAWIGGRGRGSGEGCLFCDLANHYRHRCFFSVGVGGDGGEGCLEVNQYMFFGILFLESF